jgi:hypothetical protein
MPRLDIEKAYQDRYTLAPPSRRRLNTGSVVQFAAAVYTPPVPTFHLHQMVDAERDLAPHNVAALTLLERVGLDGWRLTSGAKDMATRTWKLSNNSRSRHTKNKVAKSPRKSVENALTQLRVSLVPRIGCCNGGHMDRSSRKLLVLHNLVGFGDRNLVMG